MVLLEDFAALIGLVFALLGVGLTLVTGNGIWDARRHRPASALLLVVVAVVLAIETKSLLLGEARPAEARCRPSPRRSSAATPASTGSST